MQIRSTPIETINNRSPEPSPIKNGDGSSLPMLPEEVAMTVSKKPVTSTLRGLSVGEYAIFPMEQRTSVLVVANRLKKELARQGWDYTYCDDDDNFSVAITRTA